MTEDRLPVLFFEIFNTELPRQGPGDTASTLQALALVPRVGPATRVLDVGCGTGPQTLALACNSATRIVAIDSHAPFVNVLNQRAQRLGIAHRIDARVGDMRHLDVPSESFDLVWSEGAIYNVGFEAGLRDWRRFLVPGGHTALTEVCWTKPDPPAACVDFWMQEYPAIRDVPALLQAIRECEYETVGHFMLPRSSWWDEFYQPLQANVTRFRERHRGESDAEAIADQIQREIDAWHAWSEFYGYEFFVMRGR